MKKQLLDLNKSELNELVVGLGQAKYRTDQLLAHLLNGDDYDSMTTLPKSFLEQLHGDYHAQSLVLSKVQVSQDGTKKYLFELKNGGFVESVFLPNKYGNTICISSQVGCKFACKFCASGLSFDRNLTPGEILGQVLYINKDCGGNKAKRAMANIVMMGSGEPLDNFDNVVKFLNLVISQDGLNFSNRNISLSTSGVVEKIKDLADLNLGITLSISLHATTDESRRKIMPVANKYSVKEVIEGAKYYFERTGRRVAFEYLMIKDLNTNHLDATRLAELTKHLSSHVNLIQLNWVAERTLEGITKEAAKRFCDKLNNLGVSATIRRSQGNDIDGACGQLRNGQTKKLKANTALEKETQTKNKSIYANKDIEKTNNSTTSNSTTNSAPNYTSKKTGNYTTRTKK